VTPAFSTPGESRFPASLKALTPPELVRSHLNLDARTMAALGKDKPVIVRPSPEE
jgi:hypothetical protein